jgi:hypothetical protein
MSRPAFPGRILRPTIRGLLTATACLAVGCAAEPFARPPLPVLKNPDPHAVRDNFQNRLPDGLDSLDPAVIRFPFVGDMTFLNQLEADRVKDTFRVSGFMPMGLLAFDLCGDRGRFVINSAVSQLMEHRELLLSIGHDLREAYLDLTPATSAAPTVWPKEVHFSQKTPDGTLSFEYAYDPPVLIEKRMSGFLGTVWRIRYYDYHLDAGGKLHPRGIVLDNSRYHYQIVVRGEDLQKRETP